jgi:AcrR family transcriptional regulator
MLQLDAAREMLVLARQPREGRGQETALDASAVLEAAMRLVQRHGVDKLSMRGLARELGVSPMAIYHHVPSKEALLDQLKSPEATLVPSGPRRGSAQPLNEQEIVAAGLQLLRCHGAEALSMRGLARQLGVSVMALYHYVRSKEELLDKLREAVLSRVPTPPDSAGSWESQLRAYALAGATLLAEYPGLLRFAAMAQPTPSEKRLTRHGIAVLLAAGCEPRTAALAIKTYHTQIFGMVIAQAVEPAGTRARAPRKLKQDEVALVARQSGQLGFRESAEFGIDTVLAGLRSRISEAREQQESDSRKARRG